MTMCPRSNQFHVDHVFPSARLTVQKLRRSGIAEAELARFEERKNALSNLQLPEGPINVEKRASMPQDWLETTYIELQTQEHYRIKYDLGELPRSLPDFPTFIDARRERLSTRLTKSLKEARLVNVTLKSHLRDAPRSIAIPTV
jgi:hypothetical protein